MWLEEGAIKSFRLTPDLKSKFSVVKGAVYKTIEDVGLSEHGQFVATTDDGSGRVVKLTPEGLKVIWEFSDSVGPRSSRLSIARSDHVCYRLHLHSALDRSTPAAWMWPDSPTSHACFGCTR